MMKNFLNIDLFLRANVFDIDFNNYTRIRYLKTKDYSGNKKIIYVKILY